MNWPRTLVFASKAPSSSAASAQVLARLTSGIEKHFGYICPAESLPKQATSVWVPVKNAIGFISRWPILWRFEQFGWYHAALREGLREAAKSEWDVILACCPNMPFALAAARVAQITGLPVVLYLMDLFAESRVNPIEKIWAGVAERKLIRQASSLICLTEGLQKHYSRKYAVDPVLIQHCVTESEIAEAIASKPSLVVGSPVIVAYAGGVYQARLDSLMVVKQAIEELNVQGCPSRLLVLGENEPAQLAAFGIGGPYVSVHFIKDRSEFMRQLRRSDILLSTIAFNSAYPLQDQTCLPTKTFDYLLAGKPVLVVGPDRADYAAYMKKNMSAMVATVLDSKVVAKRIYQLATDMATRKQLVDSGFIQLKNHNHAIIQASFNRLLKQAIDSCAV